LLYKRYVSDYGEVEDRNINTTEQLLNLSQETIVLQIFMELGIKSIATKPDKSLEDYEVYATKGCKR